MFFIKRIHIHSKFHRHQTNNNKVMSLTKWWKSGFFHVFFAINFFNGLLLDVVKNKKVPSYLLELHAKFHVDVLVYNRDIAIFRIQDSRKKRKIIFYRWFFHCIFFKTIFSILSKERKMFRIVCRDYVPSFIKKYWFITKI